MEIEEAIWKSVTKRKCMKRMCLISEDVLEYLNWTNALSIKFFKEFIIIPLDCKSNYRNINYWIEQVENIL